MEIAAFRHVNFTYPDKTEALSDISLSLEEGGFYLLCGPSGCGKSTLLRQLKKALVPTGDRSGSVTFRGTEIDALSDRTAACQIGFVDSDPEHQIVTDKVWHELAFGTENLGLSREQTERRVAEMAHFFGISHWLYKNTEELSGGEKQILNLASVMAMHPQLLLLDEPTGQLDPLAARRFFDTVLHLNRELGLTILCAEHQLESVFAKADQVLFLQDGKLAVAARPRAAAEQILSAAPEFGLSLPAAFRLRQGLSKKIPGAFENGPENTPLTVREGRRCFLQMWQDHFASAKQTAFLGASSAKKQHVAERAFAKKKPSDAKQLSDEVLAAENVSFRYTKDGPDVLSHASLVLRQGEIFALVGENGCGKSTMLSVLSGVKRPYEGQIRQFQTKRDSKKHPFSYGKNGLVLLPQNPKAVFDGITVAEEMGAAEGEPLSAQAEKLLSGAGLLPLLNHHPYDLSSGQQQRLALSKVLLREPSILLLDEPTKGLDAPRKADLVCFLKSLSEKGLSLLIVTHDLEFAAECADRVAMFFDGGLIGTDVPGEFFSENPFYTTAVNRMVRDVFPNAITCKDVTGRVFELLSREDSCADIAGGTEP